MKVGLRMTEGHYQALRGHLFPGDGREAMALLICGRREGEPRTILTTRRIVPVPYEQCSVREADRLVWSTDIIDGLVGEVWKAGDSLVKIHSHPNGFPDFSRTDDESDRSLAISWDGLFSEGRLHGSAVMLPDGSMFGRGLVDGSLGSPFDFITVPGDEIHRWARSSQGGVSEAQTRHAQAFGRGTMEQLGNLRVAVVGCSGTGSFVIEMLARLGVGELVLIDPDVVEEKNLNRIVNSTALDALKAAPKVQVLARFVESLQQAGQRVVGLKSNLDCPEAVLAVADSDVVFGCVDTTEGRNLLNRIAAYYLLPYFDVGVSLVADGQGGVDAVAGAVHYYKPGGSTLLERGVYTMAQVQAEEMKRTNPEAYADLLKEKYIQGVNEERPAVISVNSFFSAVAVNEFLARVHPFRNLPNSEYAILRGDLCEVGLYREAESPTGGHLSREIGKGDRRPLLERPSLSR